MAFIPSGAAAAAAARLCNGSAGSVSAIVTFQPLLLVNPTAVVHRGVSSIHEREKAVPTLEYRKRFSGVALGLSGLSGGRLLTTTGLYGLGKQACP